MQIKNFAELEYLTRFELIKHESQHSRLNFVASVAVGGEGNFFARVGEIISVSLDDGVTIFCGRVEAIELERAFNALRVHASCVSLSIETDEQLKTRIFHNPDKKISDVLEQSRLKLENCGLKLSDEISSKKYEGVLLQNQETNFNFIARLARALNSRLWIIDTMTKAEIRLDKRVGNSPRKIGAERLIYIRQGKRGGRRTMTVRTEDYFDLGAVVTVETDSRDMTQYVIVGLRAELTDERYLFEYELDELEAPPAVETNAPTLAKTIKLHATVKSVDDPEHRGRVQVVFDDKFIEDMDQKNPLWIEYRSPYVGTEGGIVFMPDKGDAIEVLFGNEEVYAVSTLRKKPLGAECRNVVDKYIGNNFEQRIFWKEKSLELLSSKNKITMNDKAIELTVGSSKLVMNDKAIELTVGGSKLTMTDKTVKIKTVGGELEMN